MCGLMWGFGWIFPLMGLMCLGFMAIHLLSRRHGLRVGGRRGSAE